MSRQRWPGHYPAELRERAVRLVREGEAAYRSEWEAICAVAEMLGPTAETVREWVRRAEIDAGERPGLKTEERERLKALERENFELRRANEILRSASLFFATELDGHRTRATAPAAGRVRPTR
jgi:transposase